MLQIIKLAMKISMYCRTVEYSNTPEDMDVSIEQIEIQIY